MSCVTSPCARRPILSRLRSPPPSTHLHCSNLSHDLGCQGHKSPSIHFHCALGEETGEQTDQTGTGTRTGTGTETETDGEREGERDRKRCLHELEQIVVFGLGFAVAASRLVAVLLQSWEHKVIFVTVWPRSCWCQYLTRATQPRSQPSS